MASQVTSYQLPVTRRAFTLRFGGFTLAELLISVSIIALITSSTVAGFANVLRRARDTKRLADMEAIHTALDSYYADKGHYPGSADGITQCGLFIGVGDRGPTTVSCRTNPIPQISIDQLLAPYMGDVPHDPLHDSTDFDSSNGITSQYFYAYDPQHNIRMLPTPPDLETGCSNGSAS